MFLFCATDAASETCYEAAAAELLLVNLLPEGATDAASSPAAASPHAPANFKQTSNTDVATTTECPCLGRHPHRTLHPRVSRKYARSETETTAYD